MWMVPRNIRRIEPWKITQICALLDACGGNAQDQALQDVLYAELEKQGIKCPRSENGVPNPGGLRTYLAQLACLGLFWQDPKDRSYSLTRAGGILVTAETPTKVLTCQLLRMQYPSVYGNGHNVAIAKSLKVKPFVFLLDLLDREDLGGTLTSEEIAVAVVYGRTHADEDKVAAKILSLRSSGDFKSVIDRLEDICTPRRWKDPEDALWEKGIEDAKTIGNTFKCYMEAVGLVAPLENESSRYSANISDELAESVALWRKEPIEAAPAEGYEARWQIRFGRWDREKAQTFQSNRRTNGFAALLSSRYIACAKESPYGFDHEAFVKAEAQKWHKTETEIEAILGPFRPKTKDLFHDTLMRAAFSGGEEALLLEKGVTSIFRQLGFDQSFHCGQKKAAKGRRGGYPDVYVKASGTAGSGWADSKATSHYGFPIADTSKLGTYYKECWSEIDPASPSRFFLYIAGGFSRSVETISASLRDCAAQFGRPVSAVTVEALCELVERDERPAAAALTKAFVSGKYFNSASQLIEAAAQP